MLSRRDLVGKLATGAAGMVALAVSGTRAKGAVKGPSIQGLVTQTSDPVGEEIPSVVKDEATTSTHSIGAPPWELLAPLKPGAAVAHGWRVADLSGPANGACVLTLTNERGRVQRVHLCRNDGRPQGLVYTRRLDLVVMNGGRGDRGTEENLAQAVAAVAHVVAANENRGDRGAVADALLPHAERLRRFSSANEWTLR